jgi:hypothetical protein
MTLHAPHTAAYPWHMLKPFTKQFRENDSVGRTVLECNIDRSVGIFPKQKLHCLITETCYF